MGPLPHGLSGTERGRRPSCSPSPRRRGGWGAVGIREPHGRLGRFAFLAMLLAIAVLIAQPAHGQEPSIFGPLGTIVAPHGAGVLLTNVATGAEEPLAVMPPVGINGHAAWSPDRTRLAISRFARRPSERVGGSDILVLPDTGGEAIPVAEHDLDGALLGAPAWLPDSSGLFYDRLPPSGSPTDSQVLFSPIDMSAGARVISNGGWPAVSPDGRLLAY